MRQGGRLGYDVPPVAFRYDLQAEDALPILREQNQRPRLQAAVQHPVRNGNLRCVKSSVRQKQRALRRGLQQGVKAFAFQPPKQLPGQRHEHTVLNPRLRAVRWKQCASYTENAILDAAVVGIDLALGMVASVGPQRVAGKEGCRFRPGYLFTEGRHGPEVATGQRRAKDTECFFHANPLPSSAVAFPQPVLRHIAGVAQIGQEDVKLVLHEAHNIDAPCQLLFRALARDGIGGLPGL